MPCVIWTILTNSENQSDLTIKSNRIGYKLAKYIIQFCYNFPYSLTLFGCCLQVDLIYSNSCPALGPSGQWSATSGSVLSKNNAAGRNIAAGGPSMQLALNQTTFVLLNQTTLKQYCSRQLLNATQSDYLCSPSASLSFQTLGDFGLLSSCLLETK